MVQKEIEIRNLTKSMLGQKVSQIRICKETLSHNYNAMKY